MKVILVVVSMLLVTVTMNSVSAQEREQPITVECGDILEGEFDANFQEQNYSINLEAGTALSVTATPLGSS